jgi:hypothetical protein
VTSGAFRRPLDSVLESAKVSSVDDLARLVGSPAGHDFEILEAAAPRGAPALAVRCCERSGMDPDAAIPVMRRLFPRARAR